MMPYYLKTFFVKYTPRKALIIDNSLTNNYRLSPVCPPSLSRYCPESSETPLFLVPV